jgi:hypothetical protein
MSSDDGLENLAEYLRLNLDAGVSETLRATETDPDVWADAVETAIASGDPHTVLTPPTDEDIALDEDSDEPSENPAPEGGSTGSNPP